MPTQSPDHATSLAALGAVGPRPEDASALGLCATSPATILCVDDEPDAIAVLDWFLTREGFVVITAGGGAEALLRVQKRLPDFVITDQTMPGMSGLELCKQLRASHETRHIPIILYTALSLPAVSQLYDRRLIKPADLDVLVSAIRVLLNSAH